MDAISANNSEARFFAIIYRRPTLNAWNLLNRVDIDGALLESELFERGLRSPPPKDPECLDHWDKQLLKLGRGIWSHVTTNRWLSYRRFGDSWRPGAPFKRSTTLAIVQTYLTEFDNLFRNYNPSALLYVTTDVGTPGSDLLEHLARLSKVPVIVPKGLRIGGRYLLGETILSRDPVIDRAYDRLLGAPKVNISQDVILTVAGVQNGDMPPSFMKPLISRQKKNRLQRVLYDVQKYIMRSVQVAARAWRSDPYLPGALETELGRIMALIDKLRIKLTVRYSKQDSGVRYVYFPLHVQPEFSVELYAPDYSDQISVIRQVARCLPADVELWVKDHPAASGAREASFYRQISQIPNVRLLESANDSLALVRGSMAVATITGTAGLEGLLMGKPVLTFGNVFYRAADKSVYAAGLPEQIRKMFRYFRDDFRPDWEAIHAFCQVLLEISFDVDVERLAVRLHSARSPEEHQAINADVAAYAEEVVKRLRSVTTVMA